MSDASAKQATCAGACCLSPMWSYNPDPMTYYQAPINSFDKLTFEEKDVLYHLKEAWEKYIALEKNSTDNLNEFRDAIHRCQQLIALRVARRVDPDVWAQPE